MSIDNLLANLGLVQRRPNGLEAQLSSLQSEVRRLARSLSRRAGQATDEWSNEVSILGREAVRQGSQIAGAASQQAIRGARAFGRDPLPVIAIIGTAFLVARLFRR
jgi:hypothetical protein